MATHASYTLKNVTMSYAAFGGASIDCKNGIAEGGCTIALAEDYGERTAGGDGSTMWSEYMTSHGTVMLNVMPYSPVYAFFVTLQTAQRATGSKGSDTMTIVNKNFSESFTCSAVAIQSISGETFDKAGNTVRVITLSCGEISRIGGQGVL